MIYMSKIYSYKFFHEISYYLPRRLIIKIFFSVKTFRIKCNSLLFSKFTLKFISIKLYILFNFNKIKYILF